jgi:serine/threonine protein kinase/formylglycine-generating enzyme required for sulfatase activity
MAAHEDHPVSDSEPQLTVSTSEMHPQEPLSDGAIDVLLGIGRGLRSSQGRWEPPAVEELQAGFPQYEIVAILGRGGMGAVYQGRQKSLDRLVAIKILPPGFEEDMENLAARFEREGKAMARFKHPGIVAVYDAGQTSDGLLYFIMEYVEGTDVGQMLATQGRLPVEQALTIATHVCAALDYAHQHGVIHRDIKPSNVLLDRDGTVRVADFGLAKTVSQDNATHTRSDISMGTPDYMPPEALTPGMKVDHRADLYALGAMLYQMLTGRLPRGRFDPPSRAVPGLDKRLDRIVDRALQPERNARYSSAIEFRAELDPILTRTIARCVTASGRTAASRKNPLLLATLAVAVVAGLAAIISFAPRKRDGIPSSGGPRSVVAQTSAGEGGRKVGGDGASPSNATKDAPFVNTLGMNFVPVPITGGPTAGQRVLFSVWETRVRDYEVFAGETKREWPKIYFSQGATHPALNVTWDDAQLFCQWLTAREQSSGRLPVQWRYRLPSDHEWSCAIGIGEREDAADLPSEKHGKIAGVFPWGGEWPPPQNVGNLAGEELQPALTKHPPINTVIAGYRDEFVETSPVGSFAANRFGLFDLEGNAREWCEDWYDPKQASRVVRGGSWCSPDRDPVLVSWRSYAAPTKRTFNYGSRVVLSPLAGTTPHEPSHPASRAAARQHASTSATATKDQPFENSLGMKFVPVPITGGPTDGQRVLFSVWETRVQDYEAFAKQTHRPWAKPEFPQSPTHPAVNVSWEEARLFCAWLTEREQQAGQLGLAQHYRLPSDHEWSCAAGIGAQESATKTPQKKNRKIEEVFPWGDAWPPSSVAGNYSGEEVEGSALRDGQKSLTSYRDAFPHTAPVGSFLANAFGLYDLGGNVKEWCDDLYGPENHTRVARGASFAVGIRGGLFSSYRYTSFSNLGVDFGFRVVLEGRQ